MWSKFLAPVDQTMDSAITGQITIQRISIRETNCAIQWIVICYPVDSAIQRLNNRGLDRSWILNDRIYVQTKELRKSSSSVYVYNVAKKSTIKCDKLTELFFAYKDPCLFSVLVAVVVRELTKPRP